MGEFILDNRGFATEVCVILWVRASSGSARDRHQGAAHRIPEPQLETQTKVCGSLLGYLSLFRGTNGRGPIGAAHGRFGYMLRAIASVCAFKAS